MNERQYRIEARRFAGIQLHRYLRRRPGGRFTHPAERDAVLGMIRDAWVELRASGEIDAASPEGLSALYATCLIVFPTFVADMDDDDGVIPVDFARGYRIQSEVLILTDGSLFR